MRTFTFRGLATPRLKLSKIYIFFRPQSRFSSASTVLAKKRYFEEHFKMAKKSGLEEQWTHFASLSMDGHF